MLGMTASSVPEPPVFQAMLSTFPVMDKVATLSSHKGSGSTKPDTIGGSMGYAKDSEFSHPLSATMKNSYPPGPAWVKELVPSGHAMLSTSAPALTFNCSAPDSSQQSVSGVATTSVCGTGSRLTSRVCGTALHPGVPANAEYSPDCVRPMEGSPLSSHPAAAPSVATTSTTATWSKQRSMAPLTGTPSTSKEITGMGWMSTITSALDSQPANNDSTT